MAIAMVVWGGGDVDDVPDISNISISNVAH